MDFFQSLLDPGRMVLDPSKRVYWLCLLGSLGMILVLSKKGEIKKHLALAFSSKIWFHRSSRTDVFLVAINGILRPLILPAQLSSVAAIAALVSWSLTKIFGVPGLESTPWLVAMGFTLVTFIADDFSRFFLHYCQHRFSFLWAFHKVHHSAEVLTPLTLYRSHPVDILSSRLRHIVCHGLVTGLFFFLFQQQLNGWDILGANAFAFIFNALGANLRHSHIPIHFGLLERIFISPLAHQVHHSLEQAHYDKNFGSCLALWDRLFESHIDGRDVEGRDLSFGIEESYPKKYSLVSIYLSPFQEAFKAKEPKLCPEAGLDPTDPKPIESPMALQG
ncbi:sterol desaturase family protein [Pseudobacteriovorax antillogorgiicola]|uniref:sterol desaturase family protein n=1 Tax=Pseudobacteriovorax antillogorgiicola TaxID=1513793 RepID=UPI001F354E4F|nr:sterol desaturase family protein [Pseudobacteriovorax antillogorgiicola]